MTLISLPTQDTLPCDDGIPMETQRHKWQMDLLLDAFDVWLESKEEGFASGNMFLYFSMAQLRDRDFRGPDFFAVLGVPKKERKSWVVWEEGKAPDVVIELLSESTIERDKTEKKLIYQDRLRVPEYFWYDPFNPDDRAGFSLQNGLYQPIPRDRDDRLPSHRLGLSLVLWNGVYRSLETTWLRWATLEGEILPTHGEKAEQNATRATREALQATQEADRAKQEASQAQQEADRAKQEASQAQQEADRAKQEASQAQQEADRAKQEASQAQQEARQALAVLEQIARNLHQQGMSSDRIVDLTGLSPARVAEILGDR